jgi:hypothetical protein
MAPDYCYVFYAPPPLPLLIARSLSLSRHFCGRLSC